MTRITIAASIVAAAFLASASAFAADDAKDHHGWGHWDPAQFAAHHKEMCADRFAHRVGEMAYIEARLSLTDSQRPLFDAWKSAVLSTAKSREDNCESRPAPDFSHPPSILDRQAHEHERLQARLAALDAEGPALQSLYASLTPDQQKAFSFGDHGMRGGHGMHGFHHHGGMRGPGEGGPDGDGGAGGNAPPNG